MMQLSLYNPVSARRLLPASESGVDGVGAGSDEIIDRDTDRDTPQKTVSGFQPPEGHNPSALTEEVDEFDDLLGEFPNEEEDEDFKALLDGSYCEDMRDEFEDLFEGRGPGDNEVVLDDSIQEVGIHEGVVHEEGNHNNWFEDDEMDIDMIFRNDPDSWEVTQETRPREVLVDSHYERTIEMQIDNQCMLI
jgi:hypothetical protein